MMQNYLKWLAVALLLLAVVGAGSAWLYYQRFLQTPLQVTEANSILEVKPGAHIRQVARQLQSQGILPHALPFWLHARWTGQADKIKAGEYQLAAGMTPDDLLRKLVKGEVIQYSLTIIEGKTFKDVMQAIRRHPHIKQTLGEADLPNLMAKLGGSADASPEGWFLPDTYLFPRNTTDVEFLKRAYQAMQDYLQQAWEKRVPHPHIKSPYEALVLASIVEKETGLAAERPLVAMVFLNRLEKGMLLQTDPTVIYGMGDKYDGNIRKKDLQTDTPYNTYTRPGLTPTPIAMPSKAAIDAVMHPADSKALYFVAKEAGGASHFSETLEEHNRAVQRYILKRTPATTANSL